MNTLLNLTDLELYRSETSIYDRLRNIESIGARGDKYSKSPTPAADRAALRKDLRAKLMAFRSEQDRRGRAKYAETQLTTANEPIPASMA